MLGMHRTGPIGLDFGTEELKIVQADFSRQGAKIRSAVSLAYPVKKADFYASPAALKQLLKTAREQGSFKGNRAVVAIPPDKVQFVSLEYKYSAGDDPDETVIEAIKERFGDSLGSSVIDYLHIRPEHKEQADRTALVAVANEAVVIEFLEFLSKAGLDVERLEIGPVAINRLISAMNPSQNDKVILAVNFGLERSYATVLWGRRLLLDRALSFGVNTGIQQVAEAMEISFQEAGELLFRHGVQTNSVELVGDDYRAPSIEESLTDILKPSLLEFSAEIKRLMLYVASRTRGRSVHGAYIFGGLASWPGIDQLLAEMTGLPLVTTRPFYGLMTSSQVAKLSDPAALRGIAVATGLALNGSDVDA